MENNIFFICKSTNSVAMDRTVLVYLWGTFHPSTNQGGLASDRDQGDGPLKFSHWDENDDHKTS